MITWILIWLLFWIIGMGLPNYFFKKYKITYYEKPLLHTIWYLTGLLLLFFTYKNYLYTYFREISHEYFLILFGLLFIWLFIPKFYKKDYFTKIERFYYGIPKFFEILFQQIGFLAGLLTFGLKPHIFGLVFFLIHIPIAFFIPKKFALIFTVGSLLGGFIFSSLQIQGIKGFFIGLLIHLVFYIIFHFYITKKPSTILGIHKR